MEKILSESTSLKDVNIERLKEIFPAAVSEGKINFDKLKLLLGEEVINDKEVYELTWPGKSEMINHIFDKSAATLRPNRDKSVNFDETNNVYIEGDNYEVLKLLRENYTGKIKCIYIDPPYNTGNDFLYKDDFKDSVENYKKIIDNGMDKNADTSGRFHTDWLNMMYSRVTLSREMLTDDGVAFISIDDNEVHNLRKICDEIFGERNFMGDLVWEATTQPINAGNAKFGLQKKTESILLYAKNKTKMNGFTLKEIEGTLDYPHIGEKGRCRFEIIEKSDAGDYSRPTMRFQILGQYPRQGKRWQIGEDTARKLEQDGRVEIVDGIVKKAVYPEDELDKNQYDPFWSLLLAKSVGTAQVGKRELNTLMQAELGFDTVKPIELIKKLLTYLGDSYIVLDFFSGSATTAHAVMELNSIENRDIKFIMVQLPEHLNKKSGTYKTICEIGQERIRRAANKIKKETNADIDYGFKVFELDSSNIVPHNENTILREETLLPNRTNEDILYEIIIKHGFPLDVHVEEVKSVQGTYFKVAYGRLFIFLDCINQELVEEVVNSIRDEQGEDDPNIRFVIKEQLFNGDNRDSEKATCEYLLEQFGYKNIKTI